MKLITVVLVAVSLFCANNAMSQEKKLDCSQAAIERYIATQQMAKVKKCNEQAMGAKPAPAAAKAPEAKAAPAPAAKAPKPRPTYRPAPAPPAPPVAPAAPPVAPAAPPVSSAQALKEIEDAKNGALKAIWAAKDLSVAKFDKVMQEFKTATDAQAKQMRNTEKNLKEAESKRANVVIWLIILLVLALLGNVIFFLLLRNAIQEVKKLRFRFADIKTRLKDEGVLSDDS